MHRGRPVALTGAERRALRMIEAALDADDPALSLLLDAPAEDRRRIRRVFWTCVVIAAPMVVLGVIADSGLLSLGLVLLLVAPAVARWTDWVRRRWP
jgi:Protein of unknown function (DUF3040)